MDIKKTFSTIALAAAILASPGCMWSRVKVNDPDVVMRSHGIKEGETSEKELESILLAKPTMQIPGKDRRTLAYSFSDTKQNGLILIFANFSRTTTVAETLYVDIDPKSGKVEKVHRPHIPSVEWRFWPFSDK